MIKKWRKKIWDWFTVTDLRIHLAHLLLVLVGTLAPAGLAYWAWSSLILTIVVGNMFAEVWFVFMSCRKVADYIGHKAKGHDMDSIWIDGLGDLAGPLAVRVAWWAGLLTILFGG